MIREYMQRARVGKVTGDELMAALGEHLRTIWVPAIVPMDASAAGEGSKPDCAAPLAAAKNTAAHGDTVRTMQPHVAAGPGGQHLALGWTDPLWAGWTMDTGVALLRCDAMAYLRQALRQGCVGLVLDPGMPHGLWLPDPVIRQLLREYVLRRCADQSPYLLTEGGKIVVNVLHPGYAMLPVYLTEADAHLGAAQEKHDGVCQETWAQIWDRCEQIGAAGVMLQAGLPEMLTLDRSHLSRLCGDGRRSALDLLEAAISGAAGDSGSPTVQAALAAVDFLWVLTRPGGGMVGLNHGIDLFTSPAHAEQAARAAGSGSDRTPAVFPAAVDAAHLWDNLLENGGGAEIWINRGSAPAWSGPFETLHAVQRLRCRQVQ